MEWNRIPLRGMGNGIVYSLGIGYSYSDLGEWNREQLRDLGEWKRVQLSDLGTGTA